MFIHFFLMSCSELFFLTRLIHHQPPANATLYQVRIKERSDFKAEKNHHVLYYVLQPISFNISIQMYCISFFYYTGSGSGAVKVEDMQLFRKIKQMTGWYRRPLAPSQSL